MSTRKQPHKPRDLAKYTQAHHEFKDPGRFPDSKVRGLYIHVGPRKTVWRFLSQARVNSKRVSTFKTLGTYPEMNTIEARKEALKVAGSVASGTAAPGKRQATKFGAAFERYIAHLRDKVAKENADRPDNEHKPARWADNVQKLYDTHLKPAWENWTLYDMSMNPLAVKQWHAKLYKSAPTSADHAGRLIRACYKEEARLDRTLPPTLPTSGIKFGKIKVSQKALDFPDFGAWRAAWEKIENPVHKGYHLAGLLTGCRPGELARIRKGDVDRDGMTVTLRNAKAGNDIVLPITPEIVFALDLAANAPAQTIVQRGLKGMRPGQVRKVALPRHGEVLVPDLVFPGARQAGHRSGLPVSGNALRHTFRSVAVSLGISEMLIHFLMGHALEGVSAKYTNELIILRSAELRTAQEKISHRMFELLRVKSASSGRTNLPGRYDFLSDRTAAFSIDEQRRR
jgi:integrase